MSVQSPSYIGTSHPKREDARLIRGGGQFADDIKLDAPLYIAFIRSQFAPAMIESIETEDALESEGVFAVHTGTELVHLGDLSVNPVINMTLSAPRFAALFEGEITSIGQPIAAVLADAPALAVDGAEMVFADISDSAAQNTPIAAQSWQSDEQQGADAPAFTVEATIQHPRLAPSPMEPRAIAVRYEDANDGVTVWHSTQTPHRTRSELAAILNIDAKRIRVIARDVGGAFGMKASLYPEDVFAVWAALKHKRNVKWTATRSDEFMSATHGRGISSQGSLSLTAEGNFLSLTAKVAAPLGPWLPNSALIPAWNAARVLPSGYRVPVVNVETQAIQDNLTPTGIYRGAGRPEANMLMEQLIDKAARAADLDPLDVRRRNLLLPSALPHDTATGNRLDSGDYIRALDMLESRADYASLRAQQAKRRENGELVGIGVSFYLEPSGNGWESARVTLNEDQSVTIASGSSSQGHARETAYAQIAADCLSTSPEQIEVMLADTQTTPEGIGALASRSTAIGGSAVLEACLDIQRQKDGGAPYPITASARYENKGQAWGYGAYLVQMRICPETGSPSIEKAICVDDTGVQVNPALVKDQVVGGFAQGFGEAMMEQIAFDEDNQLLTGSFMDYAMPRAADVPPLEMHSFETPSPMNSLGAKGVGEAGTIGAPAAILSAALDALAPLGVTELNMPLTPCTLWTAMQKGQTS